MAAFLGGNRRPDAVQLRVESEVVFSWPLRKVMETNGRRMEDDM